MLFCWLLLHFVSYLVVMDLQEATCFAVLGHREHLYGQQRLWGTLSYGREEAWGMRNSIKENSIPKVW